MIRDDELHNRHDYSEGQKEAAHRILVELVNLFEVYKDDIRIVGGKETRWRNGCSTH